MPVPILGDIPPVFFSLLSLFHRARLVIERKKEEEEEEKVKIEMEEVSFFSVQAMSLAVRLFLYVTTPKPLPALLLLHKPPLVSASGGPAQARHPSCS